MLNGQEQKQSEAFLEIEYLQKKLKQTEKNFYNFFESAAIGIQWIGPDGIIQKANHAQLEMLGYKPEEYIGNPVADYHANAAGIQDILNRLSKGETLHDYPASLKCKDGSLKQVMIDFNVLWENGKFLHTRCFTRDVSRQKDAEENLRKKEQHLEAIFSQVMVGIAETDLTGQYLFVNDRYCEMVGRGRQELLQMRMQDITHPEDLAGNLKLFKASVQSGESFIIEKRYLRPDGKTIWVHNTVSAIKDFSGLPQAIVAISVDITERKHAEEELRRFKILVENSSDFIGVASPDQKPLFLNKAGQQMIGLSGGEEDSFPSILDYLPEDEKKRAQEQIIPILLEKGYWDGEIDFQNFKTGKRIPTLWNLFTIRELKTDKLQNFACISRDITERKQIEESLRNNEKWLKQVLNLLPTIIWILDTNGKFDYGNKRWYEFTGFSDEKESEKKWKSIVHPDDLRHCLDTWQAAVQSQEEYKIEYRFKDRQTGDYRWFLTRALPIKDETGKVARWFGTSTDIDDQKRNQQKLEQTAQELCRSNKELEQFAYMASHDLNEPLHVVATFTDLLERRSRGKLERTEIEYIKFIKDGICQAQTLIREVLAYSRIGREKSLEVVDLSSILTEVLAKLKLVIQETGAVIQNDPLPKLKVYRHEIIQLFQNLISNAIKYRSEKPPEIYVSAKLKKNEWTFSIKDNGIGIPPQYQERIFAMFQRFHSKADYSGTGIGLAICKKIVENHGGKIWVESQLGQGSTFYFTIVDLMRSP